ncbi:MAG: hypothetical protein ACRDKZ_04085 [Actinomycetota bacterium]
MIAGGRDRQQDPSVAFDGKHFLVVWTDYRHREERKYRGRLPDIFATRVDQGGKVLDAEGFPLSTARFSQSDPDVAFDGKRYLVAWTDERRNADGLIEGTAVFGARVRRDATVLDPTNFLINAESGFQEDPLVAASDAGFLVAWTHAAVDHTDKQGRVARVSGAGEVLDQPSVELRADDGNTLVGGVASDGDDYLVAYSGKDAEHARVVRADGTLAEPVRLGAGGSGTPTFDGDRYLVTWSHRIDDSSRVLASHVLRDGTIQETGPYTLAEAPWTLVPRTAFLGSAGLVVWTDATDVWTIYAAPLTGDGHRTQDEALLLGPAPASFTAPAVAFDGRNYLFVYRSSHGRGVYGTLISPDGDVLDDRFLIAAGAHEPAIAFDGDHYLVVWDKGGDVYGVRIDRDANIVDGRALPISSAPQSQFHAEVAAGSGGWLVAWADARNYDEDNEEPFPDLYAARVAHDGTVMDGDGIRISPPRPHRTEEPSAIVARPGGSPESDLYLLLWGNRATRVDGSGAVLDPQGIGFFERGAPVAPTGGLWDGRRFILVYGDEHAGAPRAARFRLHGVGLRPGGDLIRRRIGIAHGKRQQWTPQMTSDGSTTISVWNVLNPVAFRPWRVRASTISWPSRSASPSVTVTRNVFPQEPVTTAPGTGRAAVGYVSVVDSDVGPDLGRVAVRFLFD